MDLKTAAGFLGTDARLATDLTLVAYIFLLVPSMITGFIFARRKMFVPHHKFTMTTIAVVNWFLILFVMFVSYSSYVAPNVPAKLNEPFNFFPTIHLLTGGTAQVLATILIIRMWFEPVLPRFFRFENIKLPMRITLSLWLITAILGATIYVTWYGLPFSKSNSASSGGSTSVTPEPNAAATSEATLIGTAESSPEGTSEAASTPAATSELSGTSEATKAPIADATSDSASTSTPEAIGTSEVK